MIKKICIYLILTIFSCAYQGTPQGGPEDVDSPVLLSVSPRNESKLEGGDDITLLFDERLEPNSIIKAISIKPNLEFTSKVIKNKIIISPISSWSDNSLIKINLNRSISDVHSNFLNKNIQLSYNLADENYCSIVGKVENYSENSIYNIFVYDWPFDIISKPIEIVESDNDYNFKIDYLNYGKYILIASSGSLDIYNNEYGINTVDYIELSDSICNQSSILYIDEPLEKVKISRVEALNSKLVNIFYDNETVVPMLINSNVGDSIFINLKQENRLHEYSIEPYLYIVKEQLDTIPPLITEIYNSNSMITVNFSEPINYQNLSIWGLEDEDWLNIDYNQTSPTAISIANNMLTKIKFFSEDVSDLIGNTMLDSVKVYDINDNISTQSPSILTGLILGERPQHVIVEAKNISTNSYHRVEAVDSLFIFDSLQPGKYVFRAYEKKNNIDPLIYHSGLLDPYERAAIFSIYQDTIEVRKLWNTEGVNIKFNKKD